MKKSNIAGWKDVFSFTFIQTIKNKAFIISFLITLVLSLVSIPFLNLIKGGGNTEDRISPVKKVYIENKTSLGSMDFKEVKNNKEFSHISFETMEETFEEVSSRIEEKESDSIILSIAEDQAQYSLNFIKSSKGHLEEGDLGPLADEVTKQFQLYKNSALKISDDQLNMINAKVDTLVNLADANGKEIVKEDSSISGSEYSFIYGLLFILLMVNMIASTQIAHSIVTEKSTRVIEYLLTSVKPLAIIVGKILAMLTAVVLQIVSMIVVVFISNKIASSLNPGSGESVLSQYLPENIFGNLNIFNLALSLILIVLGLIFYATLAGLTGATVSKVEEINEALKLFNFTNLIGSYIAIGAAIVLMIGGVNGFIIFSFLFPLSSPYILPGAILIGKASLPIVATSIALQLVFIILLFRFVAKVYETLILHNGNAIKIKDLFKISKTV
ncbi:MAG: ABC transporter permease [Clostridia bacterium]|jgi:ABC-2 type transport system permease protein|nr:ABC transporter permease [Clostridia bacterium]